MRSRCQLPLCPSALCPLWPSNPLRAASGPASPSSSGGRCRVDPERTAIQKHATSRLASSPVRSRSPARVRQRQARSQFRSTASLSIPSVVPPLHGMIKTPLFLSHYDVHSAKLGDLKAEAQVLCRVVHWVHPFSDRLHTTVIREYESP